MIKNLPDNSGIYLFYNKKKELIYVGKATSLKNRVNSYFSGLKSMRPIELLIKEVKDIKWIETESVIEAAILEAKYIKKFKPKYNVIGKDDKSWIYFYLTKEDFPKLKTIREHELKDLNKKTTKKIFGPFPNIKTSEMLRILHSLFFISKCEPNQKKPCFDYQIKRCLGVCLGLINKEEYDKRVIKPLIQFLNGNKKAVIKNLERQMKLFSKNQYFEEANKIKYQIEKLKKIQDASLINKSFIEDVFKEEFSIKRIEGYDISNLGNNFKVGSMVVSDLKGPIKSEYKKFKIKTVEKQSDIDCLREVFQRRLNHPEWGKPEIVLVDGGKPQVNLTKKFFKDIFVLGIAKGKDRNKDEFIYSSLKDKQMINFIENNKNVFINLRDEAHRFAINYQKRLAQIK
ncbi:MAG: GIY-YIG nuclease family protein [Candidatus Pacebacteria bacterium]|nr:GIY-YIG nuclease family protein [Candidatus Paceibacterota bacterium]